MAMTLTLTLTGEMTVIIIVTRMMSVILIIIRDHGHLNIDDFFKNIYCVK